MEWLNPSHETFWPYKRSKMGSNVFKLSFFLCVLPKDLNYYCWNTLFLV